MITLPIRDIKKTLDEIFSNSGYSFKDFSIKLPQPLNMTFGTVDGDKISLKFVNKLPIISWKKLITISASIQEIILGNDGGIIRIKYFPDLKFKYTEDIDGVTFFNYGINFNDIKSEINEVYDDEERRKIANQCLRYADEWVTMCCASGVQRSEFSNRRLKNDCYRFVKDNVITEYKQNHGSVVISFIVIYVILPIILKWIIEKIFKKLTS